MNVAVLGGGGFIGSHVVAYLAERGDRVVAVDKQFPEFREEWWSKGAQLELDLSDRGSVWRAVAGFDRVFHFAADMGGVGYFHSDADAAAAVRNLHLDLTVWKACRDAAVPFFYPSSACIYPETDGLPLHEGLIGAGPADQMYGEEKRFMTLLFEREPLARVGVFHTIYGPGQEWDGPRAKFPPAICRKVMDGGQIEVWGDGSQMRTFLFIDDAVGKIVTVAESPAYGGPVNVGSDEEVTVRECADWLCDHAGVDADYRFRLDKPQGVKLRGCDNSEFDHRYGRPTQVPARDGLCRLFDWLVGREPASIGAHTVNR
jgi:GDP-D-mannose 3', 5'-epimerase